jgi:acyl-CoA thioester hydrolase
MGVVYYANYLVWFEVGRTDLLRERGWSYREMESDGYSLPVVEAACEYRRPARYDDELEVRTTGALLSPVRVRFDYRIVRTGDETMLAEGHTVHASLDSQGRPRRLPERARRIFQ